MEQISILGWLGSVCLAAGLYGIGNKKRNAFLLSILGETMWIIKSAYLGMWDLASICAVFLLLAVRSYCKWK